MYFIRANVFTHRADKGELKRLASCRCVTMIGSVSLPDFAVV